MATEPSTLVERLLDAVDRWPGVTKLHLTLWLRDVYDEKSESVATTLAYLDHRGTIVRSVTLRQSGVEWVEGPERIWPGPAAWREGKIRKRAKDGRT